MLQKMTKIALASAIAKLRVRTALHASTLCTLVLAGLVAVSCAPSITGGTATVPRSLEKDVSPPSASFDPIPDPLATTSTPVAPPPPPTPQAALPNLLACERKVGAGVHMRLRDGEANIPISVLFSAKPKVDEFPELTFGRAQLGASGFQASAMVPSTLLSKICAHPNLTWLDATPRIDVQLPKNR